MLGISIHSTGIQMNTFTLHTHILVRKGKAIHAESNIQTPAFHRVRTSEQLVNLLTSFFWVPILINFFKLGYIHYIGEIHSDNSSLILHIIYITPIISPFNPLPITLKAMSRDFLVLFHIGMWTPSTIYHHLNLLPSPSPLLLPTPHTLCLFYSPAFPS
jgi:hypothetical protein